jgi:hypothetical protein
MVQHSKFQRAMALFNFVEIIKTWAKFNTPHVSAATQLNTSISLMIADDKRPGQAISSCSIMFLQMLSYKNQNTAKTFGLRKFSFALVTR